MSNTSAPYFLNLRWRVTVESDTPDTETSTFLPSVKSLQGVNIFSSSIVLFIIIFYYPYLITSADINGAAAAINIRTPIILYECRLSLLNLLSHWPHCSRQCMFILLSLFCKA